MDNYFDKIQDYLDGLLSENDLKLFETELANNESLRDEMLHQKKLSEAIRGRIRADKNLDKFKDTLKGYQKESFKQDDSPVRKFSIKKWAVPIAIAACLLITL